MMGRSLKAGYDPHGKNNYALIQSWKLSVLRDLPSA